MENITEALKRFVVAVKGEGTVNDVKGNNIAEVINSLTEAYIASKTTNEEENKS